jgi:hypothetical protein
MLASDVLARDGLGLELQRLDGAVIAEVLRNDETGEITFATFGAIELSLEFAQAFLLEAKLRLGLEDFRRPKD